MGLFASQKEKNLKAGRSKEQKQVIDYFLGKGGCLGFGKLNDKKYDELVSKVVHAIDHKSEGLRKIGLDPTQVSKVKAISFEGYNFSDRNIFTKLGKDLLWRSSSYQVTWVFFTDEELFLYQWTTNLDEDGKKVRTAEYFYKDIVSIYTETGSEEREVLKRRGLTTNIYQRILMDYNQFMIVVPGDKLAISITNPEASERSIQGLKALVRERKAK